MQFRLPSPSIIAVALPVALAALLILPGLGTIPGLHGDEAWTLERIDAFARGERPRNGMTFYVAGLHQYLVWPFVAVLGRTAWAIRLPGALLNLAALGLIAWTTTRRFGPRAGLAAGLLLATAPSFATFARFGIEIASLSPFLAAVAFAGLASLQRDRGLHDLLLALLGGLALGTMAFNHVVLLPVTIALGLTLALKFRTRFLLAPVTYVGVLGFLLGCLPRLWDLGQPEVLQQWTGRASDAAWTGDILPLFDILARCWDGSLIYRRFTGGNDWFVWPYATGAFVLLVGLRLTSSRRRAENAWIWGVMGAILAGLVTIRVAPHLAIRYLIVVHVGLPVLMALVAAPLLQARVHTVRWLGGGLVAGVVTLNLFYLGTNFLVPIVQRGGGIGHFALGTRLVETSNHFLRTDALYRQLRNAEVQRIDANFFIARPLQLHDQAHALDFAAVEPDVEALGHPRVRTAIIEYDDPADNGPATPTRERDAITFTLDPTFPLGFRVYLAQPADHPPRS